jgi:hypothetical protein
MYRFSHYDIRNLFQTFRQVPENLEQSIPEVGINVPGWNSTVNDNTAHRLPAGFKLI